MEEDVHLWTNSTTQKDLHPWTNPTTQEDLHPWTNPTTQKSTPVDTPNQAEGSTPMDKLNYTIWRRIYTHRWSMDTLLHSGGCRTKVSLGEPSVT